MIAAVRAVDELETSVRAWFRFRRFSTGEVAELQALEVPDGKWTANYYAHATGIEEAIRLIREMEKRKPMGTYHVMNDVDRRVARRNKVNAWHQAPKNRSKDGASATTDDDIRSRRVALIDVDYDRPRGTSATEDELAAARDVAERIHARFVEILGDDSALGSGQSGNGAAVLIALDSLLEPKQDNKTVSAILTALDFIYGTPGGVKVDKSVIEPKRLCAAWGSTKHKGHDDPAHPHRRTSFTCADVVKPVGRDALEKLLRELRADLTTEQNAEIDKLLGAKSTSKAPASKATHAPTEAPADVFKQANAVDPAEVMKRLEIDACPNCGAGGGSDSSFAPFEANGKRGTKCFHDSCAHIGKTPGLRTNVDLVAEVRACAPIEAVRIIGGWFGFEVPTPRVSSTVDWPEPESLPGGLRPVSAFDAGLLPEALRGWIVDIADRAQCPIEYAAIGAIVSLSSVIGRKCHIQPKRHDDWKVVPNVWGLAVGPPGVMKSPALKESTRPLQRLAVRAREQYKRDLEDFDFQEQVLKEKRAALNAEIREAIKSDADPEPLKSKMKECKIAAPTERRYVVNDSTVEKLGELLNENPNGLLLDRDEIMGFLRTLDRDGHEGDRAFYLECWAGDSSFTYDRIGRGTVHIEAACVSILGGIQPGPLGDYLRAAVRGGMGDDGLVQRFQLLVYPDIARDWRNVDRWPDTAAKTRAFEVFERINARDREEGFRFSPDGQAVFDRWRDGLERRLRDPEEAPVMASHLSKYRSLMPSLALIFNLADDAGGTVGQKPAELAVRWCSLLEEHARRAYQSITDSAQTAAVALAAKIEAGKVKPVFTLREVQRAGWSGLADHEDVEHAIEMLEDLGWLRGRTVATAGRNRLEYLVNPKVRRTP